MQFRYEEIERMENGSHDVANPCMINDRHDIIAAPPVIRRTLFRGVHLLVTYGRTHGGLLLNMTRN